MKYLENAIQKFKGDALAKLIYDTIKYLVGAIVTYIFLKLIPENTTFGEFLAKKISLSVLEFILTILVIVFLTIIVYFLFNKKKFKLIKLDLQTDELTGLPNNRALSEDLPNVISWAKSEMKPFSIILMDIDDFKDFNTKYSQSTADKVLVKFGTLLAADNRITDKVYRQHIKGDEFVIITKDTILENAVKAANRKRENIAKTGIQIPESGLFNLTVCCGVAEFNPKLDDEKIILDRAFEAMKIAKGNFNKNSTESLV
ncbi:GGDEF domain-containing protein [Chryseobacterium piscium]|uniref:diguanylate cyclase n=1 Tax=Chryseobacterium piscium TaxID=333702 RepID=A0A3D9BRS5_9FLAO|nr:GGDEF domain-containing protein [Chryseobacterium piscium]REC56234.1 GGDEF domain-containing protein [Chryseobacterium piscium]